MSIKTKQDFLGQAEEILLTVRMLQQGMARRYELRRKSGDGEWPFCSDLTLPQFHALNEVMRCDCMAIKELAEALQVSPPSASAMVDRLVDMDLVLREHDTTDRRVVNVRLSERGREAVETLRRDFLEAVSELLERLGPAYAKQWCEVYQRIRELLAEEMPWAKSNGPETAGANQNMKEMEEEI